MAQISMNKLQQQIEQIRREAFAAGYAAAMQAIRELASRAAPIAGLASARPRGNTTARRTATTPATRRRVHRSEGLARSRRSADSRPQLGSNAQKVEKVLQAAAPRALRQAEIRKTLQDKGVEVSFTSVRQALGQLETRNTAEQVGDTKTWRHRGGG